MRHFTLTRSASEGISYGPRLRIGLVSVLAGSSIESWKLLFWYTGYSLANELRVDDNGKAKGMMDHALLVGHDRLVGLANLAQDQAND